MDRKEYWNEEYTKYWKKLTDEANDKNGDKTHIEKVTKGDYKTVGEQQAIEYFSKLDYDKKEKLLDYGCGFGRFFEYFSSKSEYYGIDISESMISECVKRYSDSKDRFIVAEGEELPFENNFFDKIICYGVFDACYQEQALKEMLRVLKLNGKILLSGKNTLYYCDDEQAYIAEEAARKADEAAKKKTQKAEAKTESSSTESTTTTTTETVAPPVSAPASGSRAAIVNYALQFVGNPYVAGGTSLTNGADCSGFTQSVFGDCGISIPRDSRSQAAGGIEVPLSAIQPGDLLFYSNGGSINHVALYIGNGQVVHASTAKTGIKISSYNYRTPCKAVTYVR